ncbi:hypothetical protein ACTXT7_005868 [Hymenolepis weldensis]
MLLINPFYPYCPRIVSLSGVELLLVTNLVTARRRYLYPKCMQKYFLKGRGISEPVAIIFYYSSSTLSGNVALKKTVRRWRSGLRSRDQYTLICGDDQLHSGQQAGIICQVRGHGFDTSKHIS